MAYRLATLTRHFLRSSGFSNRAALGLTSQYSASSRNMSAFKVVLNDDKVSAKVEWPGWGLNELLFWGKPPQLRPLQILRIMEYVRECAYDCGYLEYRKLEETHLSYFKCMDFEVDPAFKKQIPYQCRPFEYPVVVDLRLRQVGRSSVIYDYLIKNAADDQLFFRGSILSVAVLKTTRKPSPMPEWWRYKYVPASSGEKFGWQPFSMDATPNYVHKMVVQANNCDYYGHVNNTAYVQLCIDAVIAGSRQGIMEKLTQEILETSVTYVTQLFVTDCNCGDQITVSIWGQDIDNKNVNVKCAISADNGELIYQQTMNVALC